MNDDDLAAIKALFSPQGTTATASSADPLQSLADKLNQSAVIQGPLAHPDVDQDKVNAAKVIASQINKKPSDVYDNLDKAIELQSGKKQSVKSFLDKTKNYIKNTGLDAQIDRINGMYPIGPLPPEAQKQVEELENQKEGNTLEGVPKVAADIISGIGTYSGEIVSKAGYTAQALSEMTQGLVASGLQVLGVQMNPDTAEYHFNLSAQAAREFTAVGIGAYMRSAREKGMGQASSLIQAEVLDLGNTAMLAFPAGRAKDALEVAFANVVGKSGLKGGLLAGGKAVANQTTFAATAAAWNNMVDQLGTELSNQAEKTHIPLKTLQDQAKEIGLSTVEMAAGGLALEGSSALIGKLSGIAERAKLPPGAENRGMAASPEQEGQVTLPPEDAARAEAEAEAQRVKLAKEMAAATPMGELDKPLVPRETTPITGKEPFGKTTSERINDLATLEKNKVITASQQAELDKLRASQAKTPSILAAVDKDKGVQGIRKLLAADPENPGLKGALATAEDQAAKDSLEKQAVVNERVRQEAVAIRRKTYEDIGNLQKPLKTADPAFEGIKPLVDEFKSKGMMSAEVPSLDSVKSILTDPNIHIQDGATLAKGLEGLKGKKYWDMTGIERKALSDAVAAVGKTAQRYKKIFAQGKAIDEQAAYEMIKKSMRDPIPLTKQMQKGSKHDSGLALAANAARSSITQYQTMAEMMFGRDSLAYQITTGAVDEGVDHQMHLQRNWHDPMRKDDPISKLYKAAKINPDKHLNEEIGLKGVYRDEMNRPQDLKVTRDMLISAEMHHSDPGNWESFLNGVGVDGTKNPHHPMKVDGDVILKAIHDTLDSIDFAHIAKMKELLNGEIFDETNKTHVALNGYNMDHSDTYWPRERIPGSTEGIIDDAINNGIDKHNYYMGIGVDKSATKPRVKSTAPIYWKPASTVWAEHTRWASHYAGLGEAIDQAGRVVSDPRFKAALDDRYGPNNSYQKSFVDSLNRIAGKHSTYADVAKAVLQLNNKGVASVMGLNLHAAIRNSVLSSRVKAYVPEMDYQLGKLEATLRPRKTYRELEAQSDYFHAAKDSLRSNMTTAPSKFQEITGAPVRAGVTYAYMKEMTAAKNFALRRFNKGEFKDTTYDSELRESTKDKDHPMGLTNEDIKKLSPEDKQKAAIKYAEYVAKRTHLSPSPVYQAVGKLAGDPIAIITNTLGGEGLAATNMLMRAATEIAHSTNPKAGRRLAKTILTLGVIAPLTDYALKYGWSTLRGKPMHTPIDPNMSEKESRKAMGDFVASYLTSLAEDLPGGRGVASALFGPMQASLTPPGMVGQMSSDAISFAKDLSQAMKDKTARSRDKAIKRAIDTTFGITAQLSGVPYAGLKSLGLSPISIWDYLNQEKQP